MVQLFNAVRKQQQNMDSQVKERKTDKVMKPLDKRAFLDILMGHSHSESVGSSVKLEPEIKVRRADMQTESFEVECRLVIYIAKLCCRRRKRSTLHGLFCMTTS
jgi:hypothetical protein